MFLQVVPQNHCRIVERFGRPIKVQDSGLRFCVPLLDSVCNVVTGHGWERNHTNKKGCFIELTEQLLDTSSAAGSRDCYTKDNVKVSVDTIIRWRVVDPMKAVYEVESLHQSLLNTTLNNLRGTIGSCELDYLNSSRGEISDKVLVAISETVQRWGIQLSGLEIKEIKVNESTQISMDKQSNAERERRAAILLAEGEAEAAVRRAEANKRAAILEAEGRSSAIKMMAEAERAYLENISAMVSKEDAAKILMAQKTLEGYAAISSDPAAKIFMPANAGGIINLVGEK